MLSKTLIKLMLMNLLGSVFFGLISQTNAGETYKCKGGIYTDKPSEFDSCIGISSKKPYSPPVAITEEASKSFPEKDFKDSSLHAMYTAMPIFCGGVKDTLRSWRYRAKIQNKPFGWAESKPVTKQCDEFYEFFSRNYNQLLFSNPRLVKLESCKIEEFLEEELIKAKNDEDLLEAYELEKLFFKRNCLGKNAMYMGNAYLY